MRIVLLPLIAITLTCGIAMGDDGAKLFDEFEDVIRSQNVDKVKAFMKKNPKAIRALNHQKMTPVHVAVKYGTSDIVKVMLSKRADLKAKTDGLWTPLHSEIFFVRKDSAQVVEVLLKAGAKVDIANKDGEQPLKAMCNGWLDAGKEDEAALAVAKLLVANGADVNAKNKYGQTALDKLMGRDDSPVKTIAFLKSKGCKPGKKKEE